MKTFITAEIFGLDPQQVFVGACDIVALDHFPGVADMLFKAQLGLFTVTVEAYGDVSNKTYVQLALVQYGPVALDKFFSLQFLYPPQGGRGR